jgi:hypothetical protein
MHRSKRHSSFDHVVDAVVPSGPTPSGSDFVCSVAISEIRFNRRLSVEVLEDEPRLVPRVICNSRRTS